MWHVERKLSDYLEGELSPARRERVEAHLARCERCAGELAALRQTVARLRALPEPSAPPGLADAVMRRVRAGESRGGFGPWLRERLGALATPGFAAPVAATALGVVALVTVSSVDVTVRWPFGDPPRAAEAPQQAAGEIAATAEADAAEPAAPAAPRAEERAAKFVSPSTLASIGSESRAPSRPAPAPALTPEQRAREALRRMQRGSGPTVVAAPSAPGAGSSVLPLAEGRCAEPGVRDPLCIRIRALRLLQMALHDDQAFQQHLERMPEPERAMQLRRLQEFADEAGTPLDAKRLPRLPSRGFAAEPAPGVAIRFERSADAPAR